MGRTYVALDTEATGLRADADEIIEIGAVKFRDATILDTFQTFVRPSQPIPYKISALTGITWHDVQNAKRLDALAPRLFAFVGDAPIVGQSIEVDLGMLARQGVRFPNRRYDTFELATLLLPEVPVYNLAGVARALGVAAPNQHRALADAELAMNVFRALVARLEELPLEVIAEINRAGSGGEWSLRPLLQEIEREATRSALSRPSASAASIAAKLAAQGLSQTELELGLLRAPELPEPLPDPTDGPHKSIDDAALARLLEPGGAMEQTFPDYEYRSQQVDMMRAVARAFNEKKHLMVEAGTGTGKSMAYLLPAIQFAVKNNTRVVISTNTINLQDQIYRKDIPALRAILTATAGLGDEAKPQDSRPATFTSALLKGRSNYLCLRRWSLFRKQIMSSLDELHVLTKVLIWLPATNSGDKTELLLVNNEPAVWSRIAVTQDGCPLYECVQRQKGRCFFYRARRNAEAANVLVVNHALLLADIASGNRVLPPYKHLIIDEAHHLEDEATSQLGYEASQNDLLELLNNISRQTGVDHYEGFLEGLRRMVDSKTADHKAALTTALTAGPKLKLTRKAATNVVSAIDEVNPACERARYAALDLFNRLAAVLDHSSEEKNEYDRRLRVTKEIRKQPQWSEVEMTWDNLSLLLKMINEGLDNISAALEDVAGEADEAYDELLELDSLRDKTLTMQSQMNAALLNPSKEVIYWLSSNARDGTTALHSAPLHVGQLLDRYLFSTKSSVVLTSATLSTDGSFEYVRERIGLQNASELHVDSPFDYVNSTMLYVADDLPEPNQPGYQRALEQTLIELCRATQGRALVLFTSHSALRTTYRAIQRPLEQSGLLVLGHNIDGSRRQLLEHFKTAPRTVLLGTSSFWEGIDVIGDALSVLVLAKLPFKVPSDPVFAARSELFDEPFLQYSVPQTVIRFKQGFGRLIRSKTDRGVVAVLDRRVVSKRYGQIFLNSLPICTQRFDAARSLPQTAADWLEKDRLPAFTTERTEDDV